MMSERQIKERIFRLKEEIRVLEEVVETKSSYKTGRPIGSVSYSNEQTKFLRENKEIPMKELIKMFNDKFGTDFPKDSRALYNFMDRSGITIPKFSREYAPRLPTAIDKDRKTKEKKLLKDLKINEESP